MSVVEKQFKEFSEEFESLKFKISKFKQRDQESSDENEIEEEKVNLVNQFDFKNQKKLNKIEKA